VPVAERLYVLEFFMSTQALPAQAKQLFHYLFEQASLGIAVEDLEGKLLLANPALCSMLGYREDEMCGMSCYQFGHPEDSQEDGVLFQRLCAGVIDKYSVEKRYLRKQGGQIWGRVNVSLWRNADGESPLIFAFLEDITERKLTDAALSSVSRRLIEAQEQERSRIARELHDDIGQRLAILAINLAQIQLNPPNSSELPSRIGELQKKTSEIAADIQSMSHELHSSRLQFLGIVAAMRGFCSEFGEQHKVEIDVKIHDLPVPLSPDISLCFFRVLQEALHNSAKHSGVQSFEVELWGTPDEIHLAVSDFGAGFDIDAAKASPGLGLISMEERLKLLNGTLSIESQLQRGTTIHARAPFTSGKNSLRAVE
jgi:PAS domain S-box-containing protein